MALPIPRRGPEDPAPEAVSFAESPEGASVQLQFSDGATLVARYWRIISKCLRGLSSFDHGQIYGLTSPISAVEQLQRIIGGRPVDAAQFNERTGDLVFVFQPEIEFYAFNFSGYEVWEIRFSDGTGEYSNNAFESASES